jgi:hypothetical protein
MGQRPNAQGYDLNRDHMKLDSPEARSLVRMMNEYDPHVLVDLHTTNGSMHAYHLTYSPPLNPNTFGPIDDLLRSSWLPEVTRTIKRKFGWDYYYYGNLPFRSGSTPPGWYTFDHRPRFNNNYVGLRNRVAILSEAYAYATFRDRVLASLYFVEEIVNYAWEHAGMIRSLTARADTLSVVGDSLAVQARPKQSAVPVQILLSETVEEVNPYTGATILLRTDTRTPETMYEYGSFEASEVEVAPAFYLVPSALSVVRDRLDAHGIQYSRLPSEQAMTVEAFRIDSTSVAERPFQGHNERALYGSYESSERALPAGTLVVPVDQPLGRLVFYLLEPRSDDGLVNWALLDDALEGATHYPIFRQPVN